MENNTGHELDWNSTIEKDSGEFILLPEGDYEFKVGSFERGRHPGSENLPACNKATVFIEIEAPQGIASIKHNMFLHTKTEGLLSSFFAAIGQKKKGEKLQMNWNTVTGSTGRVKIGIRSWTGNDGREMQSNEIVKFYPKEDQPAAAYTAGRF